GWIRTAALRRRQGQGRGRRLRGWAWSWPQTRPARDGKPAPRRYNRGMTTAPAKHAPATPTQPETATPLRFVTAASLFDGHDAAINIMRRLIQAQGAEVVHLGHN